MVRLTLECWSRGRVEHLSILLTSLMNQTLQDWDLTILEEADCAYLKNPIFGGLLRILKQQGHKIIFLHPRNMLGCVKSAQAVMKETNTKYAMKLDDDHVFAVDALEKLIMGLEDDQSIGSMGGMLYPIGRTLIDKDIIPTDFNRWTGPDLKLWNDYSTLIWRFPDQIVDVDFVRAPFMYRADLLRRTDFIETYDKLGYSHIGFRMESEIANTIAKGYDVRTCIHTGSYMWHYAAPTGGCRMLDYAQLNPDGELYYKRWLKFHKKRVKERNRDDS